jgi:hypothetical protein
MRHKPDITATDAERKAREYSELLGWSKKMTMTTICF